jgi:outer membrane immunogenic protein
MILRIGALCSALMIAAAGSAAAADMPLKAPPSIAAFGSWSGFYIGGDVGGTWARDQFDHSPLVALMGAGAGRPIDAAAQTSAASPTLKGSEVSGGLYAGYNWQTGRAVWGVEADVSDMGVGSIQTGVFAFPSTLPGGVIGPPTVTFPGTNSFHVDWQATFRGRLGLSAHNWLFYGTSGLAVAGVRESQIVGNLIATAASSSFGTFDARAGWIAGGGVEKVFGRNWIFRLEYLHADYGNAGHPTTFSVPTISRVNVGCTPGATFVAPAGGFSATTGCSISNHLTTDTVRIGLAYKFGGPLVAKY